MLFRSGPRGLVPGRSRKVLSRTHVPVIVFWSAPERWSAEGVLRTGGWRYVMRSAPSSVLGPAVRGVPSGGVLGNGAVSDSILRRMRPGAAVLSARQVCAAIANLRRLS